MTLVVRYYFCFSISWNSFVSLMKQLKSSLGYSTFSYCILQQHFSSHYQQLYLIHHPSTLFHSNTTHARPTKAWQLFLSNTTHIQQPQNIPTTSPSSSVFITPAFHLLINFVLFPSSHHLLPSRKEIGPLNFLDNVSPHLTSTKFWLITFIFFLSELAFSDYFTSLKALQLGSPLLCIYILYIWNLARVAIRDTVWGAVLARP